MPVTDVSNMKVADLKRELKVRGLSVVGNKTELQERLQEALGDEPLLEDASITGEDILDEGVLSDEEKILGADEHELLKSPTTTPTTLLPKTTSGDGKEEAALIDDDILESPTTTTKKIILKRKSSINSGTTLETSITAKENTEPSLAKTVKTSKHNPITMGEEKKEADEAETAATKKVKELTLQERLELRAKKFGVEAKAAAATISDKDKNAAISVAPVVSSEKQVELLKKRAERFGCVTSTNLAKLDAEEKLLKRKQRFGGEVNSSSKTSAEDNNTISSSATTTSVASTDEWAEKARKRLERFNANSKPTVTADAQSVAAVTPAVATTST